MTDQSNLPAAESRLSYRNVPIVPAGGGGRLLPQNFGDVVAFAQLMAGAKHAIPKHLRDNPGACMAVTMQALRWEMDPFLVASKSYSVNDMVAYESQLVNAVVNTRAPIRGRLKIAFEGEGDNRICTVTGTFEDGTVQVYDSPPRRMISPKNSPLWKSDPDQQHAYNSTRAWARRFCPEVLLGVYAEDELDHHGPDAAKDITPKPGLAERLSNARVDQTNGFSHRKVQREISGETINPETGEITEHGATEKPHDAPPTAAGPTIPAGAESAATGRPSRTDEPFPGDVGAVATNTNAADPDLNIVAPTAPTWARPDHGAAGEGEKIEPSPSPVPNAGDIAADLAEKLAMGITEKAIRNSWATVFEPQVKSLPNEEDRKDCRILVNAHLKRVKDEADPTECAEYCAEVVERIRARNEHVGDLLGGVG